ncbi:hypothetical protein AB1Y20_006180 [Prymnesium parvum]|uniref:Uncharacterized protein n=1 Tax=Prymnesium parvum TaxID=97485 RepID=A0AB34J4H9_PRYPA
MESSVVHHLGQLKELLPKASDASLPLVEAHVLPTLLPCEKKRRGDTRLLAIPSYLAESKPQPASLLKRKSSRKHRVYYVCTMRGCGWSGTGRKRHAQSRRACAAVPCSFVLDEGEPLKQQVHAFLSRCTPAQMELGLPPDGELAVPKRRADGTLDDKVLYVAVPQGAEAGSHVRIRVGVHAWELMQVPAHLRPGDVMELTRKKPSEEEEEGSDDEA